MRNANSYGGRLGPNRDEEQVRPEPPPADAPPTPPPAVLRMFPGERERFEREARAYVERNPYTPGPRLPGPRDGGRR